MNNIEQLYTRAVEALQQKSETAQQVLDTTYNRLNQPAEREEFIESIKPKIDSLDDQIREQIDGNLEFLRAKTQIDTLRNHLGSLVEEVQPTDEGLGYVFEEHKDKFIAAGIAAAVVAGTALVWRGVKAVFRRGKQTVSTAVKATRKSIFTVRNVLLFAGATALAYFGVRKAQEYVDKYRQFGNLAHLGANKLREMTAEIAANIADLQARGEEVPAELQQKLQQISVVLTEREREEREQSESSVPEQSLDAAPEQAERMQKIAHQAIVEGTVVYMHNEFLEQTGEFDNLHFHDAVANNTEKSMSTIFSCLQPDGSINVSRLHISRADREEERQSRLSAAKFLVLVCHKHKNRVLENVPSVNFDTMTVSEYMDALAVGYRSFALITNKIAESNGDLAKLMSETDIQQILLDTGDIDEAMKKVYVEQGEEYEGGAMELLFLAAEWDNNSVVGFLDYVDAKPAAERTAEEKVLAAVCRYMQDDGVNFVLPFFHDLMPISQNCTEENMREYIKHRMSVSLVARLYAYKHMIGNGNATGLFLAQLDVLKDFVRHVGVGNAFKSGQLTDRILNLSSEDAWDEFVQKFTEAEMLIPDKVYESGMKMMQVTSYKTARLFAAPIDAGIYSGIGGAGFAWENLDWAGVILSGVAAVGVPSDVLHSATFNTERIKETLQTWRGRRNFVNKILGFRPETIRHAASYYEDIQAAIHRLPTGAQAAAEKLFRRAISSPSSSRSWLEIAKYLRTRDRDAARAATRIAREAGLQRAIRAALFHHNGVLSKVLWGLPGRMIHTTRGIAGESLRTGVKGVEAILRSPHLRSMLTRLRIDPATFASAMRSMRISPALASMVAHSRAITGSLVSSFASGGRAALSRTVGMGSRALRVLQTPVGRSVSKYGSVMGLEYLFYRMNAHELNEQIEGTDNAALQEFYESQKDIAANRAIAGTGMGVGMLTGGGAMTLGFIGLPAIILADHAAGRINATTDDWLKNADDWQKKSTGEIVQGLRGVRPGEHSYWSKTSGDAALPQFYNWLTMGRDEYQEHVEDQVSLIEGSNEKQRVEMTQAYMAKLTIINPIPGETEEEFGARYRESVRRQLLYIRERTAGSYAMVIPQIYEQAETHAELMAISETLKENNESQIITIDVVTDRGVQEQEFDLKDYKSIMHNPVDNPINKFTVIQAYSRMKRDMLLLDVALSSQSEDSRSLRHNADSALQFALYNRLKHHITRFEEAMLNENLEGWGWTGGEEKSRSIIRMIASNKIRRFLREKSDEIWDAGTNVTSEQFEAAVEEGVIMLQEMDPEQLYSIKDSHYFNSEPMDNAQLYLDPQWMLQNLYVHPPQDS